MAVQQFAVVCTRQVFLCQSSSSPERRGDVERFFFGWIENIHTKSKARNSSMFQYRLYYEKCPFQVSVQAYIVSSTS